MNTKVAELDSIESPQTNSAVEWDLRHPGLIMKAPDGREVHEFSGMWPLKPDVDLDAFTKKLATRENWIPNTISFAEATTLLGLIRAARWFVGTSTEFGPTLYFVTQFDASMEKYFDNFVLNGKENLQQIWGQCIGCPTGPDASARDIVQYIARGQIKTLAVYDAWPALSNSTIEKHADWYEKTQKFQRAIAKGGDVQEEVTKFLAELAKPFEHIPSAAAIDTEAAALPQYTDLPERLGVKRAA